MPEEHRQGGRRLSSVAPPLPCACGIAAALLAAALAGDRLGSFGVVPLASLHLERQHSGTASLPPSRDTAAAAVAQRQSSTGRASRAALLQSGWAAPSRSDSRRAFRTGDDLDDPDEPDVWPSRRRRERTENGGEDRRRSRKVERTFRSVCVRLCDGYYFPVSFAAPASRLRRDSELCSERCGAQGRLFVHRNSGGSVEDMVDLQGRPYLQLGTAFRYRTEYVASCKCQPHPWETAAMERHRGYALARAAQNGDSDAARELTVLQAKLQELAKLEADNGDQPASPPSMPYRLPADPTDDRGKKSMRVGGARSKARSGPAPTASPPSAGRDWAGRVFNGTSGY